MSRVLPILFNTDMVRAILEGRKTVTRRVCKDGNDFTVPDMSFYDAGKRTYAVHNYADKEHTDKLSLVERICPICPDDILYVRETWSDHYTANSNGKLVYCYKADGINLKSECLPGETNRWYPSIHMPKEAARIWLKVTDVRVEKLQDITNEQILKEGIGRDTVVHYLSQFPENTEEWERAAHLIPFVELWNSTVKKKDIGVYDWYANPYVFVIEFERCENPEVVI